MALGTERINRAGTDARSGRAGRGAAKRGSALANGFGGKRPSIPPLRGLLPLVVILVLWQLFGPAKSVYAPPPLSWVEQLVRLWSDGTLPAALLDTIATFAISVTIATVLGTILGALVGRYRVLDRMFGPIFEFFRVLPPAAIVPLAVLIAGYSQDMKVGVVVLSAIWPILLQVRATARGLDPILFDVARVLRLDRKSTFRKVLLPSITPAILQGLRLATPILLIIVLLVEIVTRINGLGGQIQQATENYQSAAVYGLLVVTGILVLAMNVIVGALESWFLRYRPH
ncbi:ABC transporter permease [Saxibacter everestensis]|uniref:ABC transporter permease n=1 Tax=Saxibacter everestensis TaxID=2909229 RepID=A0ABY8QRW1_9MICO|nr:ABC transporter permease [Brevibacteriaceae bacterium ZFBP1038]